MGERRRRIAILAEGRFAPLDAKTAVGLLRYRRDEVAAVIDSTRAGVTAETCVGVGGAIPVVASVVEAARRNADTLLIGIAPAGGGLPEAWRPALVDALERGWRLVSGLHAFLADDPELAAVAAHSGAEIVDVRRPPPRLTVGLGRAAHASAHIVLTVGSDCNVGKMTTSLELQAELQRRGVRTAFVATGQTGIMIAGSGIAVDAVPADFVSGAAERLVLEAARDHEVVIVEGQGSLHHPAFSGVTLGLLHGSCPDDLVLCHHHGRARMRIGSEADGPAVPTLEQSRDAHEVAAAWVRPSRVVAVAVNTWGAADGEAREACDAAARALGVPATDPIRFGAGPIANAIMSRAERRPDVLKPH
jgi:uncharacterized NAD-dependent epimerase/dehydratase family protein